jgi:hypothetical protein
MLTTNDRGQMAKYSLSFPLLFHTLTAKTASAKPSPLQYETLQAEFCLFKNVEDLLLRG